MILTGKCKEEFEKWFFKSCQDVSDEIQKTLLLEFYVVSNSMKYGVYVDFFDSVGLYLEVTRNMNSKLFHYVYTDTNRGFKIVSSSAKSFAYKTRQEARTKAIEKANEIYSNQ